MAINPEVLPGCDIREEGPEKVLEFFVPVDGRARDLFEWWMATAYDDFVSTVPKMLEYGGVQESGSADLVGMGDTIRLLLGWSANSTVAMELAIWLYVVGKIHRLVSDYQQQRPGKADTWFDITVYSLMARRIQKSGRWP